MLATCTNRALRALAPLLFMVTALIFVPTTSPSASALSLHQGTRVLRLAAHLRGRPYRYGAAGPRAFDCSGYTRYVMRHAVGRHLPHNAAAQYHQVHHVSKSSRRKGDLVFFHSGGHVYHVGIYAGHGRIWNAPHTGAVVRREHIWTSAVWYGRVRH